MLPAQRVSAAGLSYGQEKSGAALRHQQRMFFWHVQNERGTFVATPAQVRQCLGALVGLRCSGGVLADASGGPGGC